MSVATWAPVVDAPVELHVNGLFGPAAPFTDDGLPSLQLLIDGRWRPARSGRFFEVRSPIDGRLIARAQTADRGEFASAIAAARGARGEFAAMPAAGRLEICQNAAEVVERELDGFVDAIVTDMGKTPDQARSETRTTIERLRLVREEIRKIFGEYLPGDWIAETAGKSAVVLREPVGTVAAFGPFNYPLFLAASKIIPALAAGNAVVAKAPSDDPVALVLFARALEQAGLPPGVLNVITGPGGDIGNLLASHEDISMISFTGSSSVGRGIAAAAG
ncbi:MAG: aldehyde dehydrogenase family protein, partial [Actinomycetota bacterium]|nr:aldehyde dehydrogenase family protein [Actinomycetota bacterium]MDQ6947477.1 aldehyde dehydrogenase family protein [Actinomycetota bacterium]